METHIHRARGPTRASTRCFISPAALLVKVMARIEPGWALRTETSQAIRRVSTRVLPEPAPATTSSGAPSWTTAARWGSLRPSSSSSRGRLRRCSAAWSGRRRSPPRGASGLRSCPSNPTSRHPHAAAAPARRTDRLNAVTVSALRRSGVVQNTATATLATVSRSSAQ